MARQPEPAASEVPARGGNLRPDKSASRPERRQSAVTVVARALIRIYQLTLSAFFGRTCRHLPTCSEYADEAITAYGLWAGGWMSVARLWRCRPLGSHGYDPIPETLPQGGRWYTPWRYGRWRSNF